MLPTCPLDVSPPEGPRPGLPEMAIGRQPGRIGNGCIRFFSGGRARPRLCIAKQKNLISPSSAALRPFRCRSVPPAGFVAMKAARARSNWRSLP